MGVRQTKFQGPITNIKFGCCTAIRLGQWVNAEVSNQVYSSNGYIVNLSDEAMIAIKAKYDGKPLKVVIRRPCGCYCIGCPASCFQCKNCTCPTPVEADFARIRVIWFARESAESCMDGVPAFILNAALGNVPHMCSYHCTPTVPIRHEDVNLHSAVPLATVVLDVMVPPPQQSMAINSQARMMDTTTLIA